MNLICKAADNLNQVIYLTKKRLRHRNLKKIKFKRPYLMKTKQKLGHLQLQGTILFCGSIT